MHYERQVRRIGGSVSAERMVPIPISPTGQAYCSTIGVIEDGRRQTNMGGNNPSDYLRCQGAADLIISPLVISRSRLGAVFAIFNRQQSHDGIVKERIKPKQASMSPQS